MSPIPFTIDDWLTPIEQAQVAEAVRITEATKPATKHTHPDTCERCGGLGCDECKFCSECFLRRGKKRRP